jgi:hypothetical protein
MGTPSGATTDLNRTGARRSMRPEHKIGLAVEQSGRLHPFPALSQKTCLMTTRLVLANLGPWVAIISEWFQHLLFVVMACDDCRLEQHF